MMRKVSLINYLVFVVSVVTIVSCNKDGGVRPFGRPVELSIVHGPELRQLVVEARNDFMASDRRLPDGTAVSLKLFEEPNLQAAQELASGKRKADSWFAPASWLVNFVNGQIQNLGARQTNCVPLFKSHSVIALSEATAEKWHIGNQNIELGDLLRRTDQELRFAHGIPETSVSGLTSFLQLYSGETAASPSQSLEQDLAALESKSFAYSSDDQILLQDVAGTNDRIALSTDQQVYQFNLGAKDSERLKQVSPKSGTMVNDYQLCLSEADWVTPAHRAAHRLFADFLASRDLQKKAKYYGFSLLDENPPTTPLPAPSGSAVSQALTLWPEVSRPLAAFFVVDTSGSMEPPILDPVKRALRNILTTLSIRDQAALLSFSASVTLQQALTKDIRTVMTAADPLQGSGGSSIYDAVNEALKLSSDPQVAAFRPAIAVFTDGSDKSSQISLDNLLEVLGKANNLRLVVIGLKTSPDVDFADLRQIARAGKGYFVEATPDELEDSVGLLSRLIGL